MKTKDEVFDKFWEFRAEVKNLKGNNIKTLRSENRGDIQPRSSFPFSKKFGLRGC